MGLRIEGSLESEGSWSTLGISGQPVERGSLGSEGSLRALDAWGERGTGELGTKGSLVRILREKNVKCRG